MYKGLRGDYFPRTRVKRIVFDEKEVGVQLEAGNVSTATSLSFEKCCLRTYSRARSAKPGTHIRLANESLYDFQAIHRAEKFNLLYNGVDIPSTRYEEGKKTSHDAPGGSEVQVTIRGSRHWHMQIVCLYGRHSPSKSVKQDIPNFVITLVTWENQKHLAKAGQVGLETTIPTISGNALGTKSCA